MVIGVTTRTRTDCRTCAAPLEKPGDYCLRCHTHNADAVVIAATPARTTVTMLDEETIVGETTITTTPEDDPERVSAERRNYVGRIVDEVRRKRPETVYLAGDRAVVRAVNADLHFESYRLDAEDPVTAAIERRTTRALEVVETPVAEKIGGSHTTLIGGRAGMGAIRTAADHPHVKKLIPGPIDAGGTASQSGLRAKVTRADDNGNLRLLLRDGSSVQENRVVTTAMNRKLGERIGDDLNDALSEAGFQ